MKYQITFHAVKEVEDWNDEEGAHGNRRMIDEWKHTTESNAKPTRTDFNDFTYDRYSLGLNQFRYWPDEPGRFTTSRIERGDGEPDEKGRFIADYDVRVTCTPLQKNVSVGTFGLKSSTE
jgi:hypothetical protein